MPGSLWSKAQTPKSKVSQKQPETDLEFWTLDFLERPRYRFSKGHDDRDGTQDQ